MAIVAIVLAVFGAINNLADGNPATNVDFAAVGSAVAAGWAVLMARANKTTSEDAGAINEVDKAK